MEIPFIGGRKKSDDEAARKAAEAEIAAKQKKQSADIEAAMDEAAKEYHAKRDAELAAQKAQAAGVEPAADPEAKPSAAGKTEDVVAPPVQDTGNEQPTGVVANETPKDPVSVTAQGGETASTGDPKPEGQEDEGIVAVPPDVEKFSYLYNEVLSTNQIMAELRMGMQELSRKIETLSADTIVKLGERASTIERQKTQLDALTAKEVTRAAAIEAVSLEIYSLKKERQEWDAKAMTLEAEKTALEQEIEALKKQISDRDGIIKTKDDEKQGLISAHNEAVTKLNSDHEKAIADLEKQQEEEIEALNKATSEQIQNAHSSIEAFVPSKVCDLFDYQIGELGDVQPKWQSIYAYLCFINGNLRQDAFVKRFREFDAAFYDAMRDTPDLLTECRVRVQKHINEELGKKTGGLQVCWPKVGEACNPDHYTTTSDFGQRISEVISAMVYKKGDDGKILCQSKGKVATA